MPTDRPSIDKLIGMTPGQIGAIFGSGVSGFSQDKFEKQYGMYIQTYDPTSENLRTEQYQNQLGEQRLQAGTSLSSLMRRGELSAAKSGFAGSGAINSEVSEGRKSLLSGYESALSSLRTGLKSDIYGVRKDYERDVYSALANLSNMGAFTPDAYNKINFDTNFGITALGIAGMGGGIEGDGGMTGMGGGTNVGSGVGAGVGGSGIPQQGEAEQGGTQFPSNPYPGQTFTDSNGTSWVWSLEQNQWVYNS